ncbi:MAG: 50S ribosomal protein L11 methyltransferase [Clostridiales bacterium]|nr:50S ribosomal protein L11 methyltransferase [Clostridiales bacterium]MCD7828592.1 50S ribosomal protein L11 methyltransferase [Clostridiales bacterium]
MDWTEIKITVDVENIDIAGAIVSMTVPYGIYIEDYSMLEEEVEEIAHIDLIDEELLERDRTKGIVHVYISPEENPAEAVSFIEERLTAENISYEVEILNCKKADWENNWKKYFKPMPVGERLLIQPIWQDKADAGGRKVLNLEPGLAFGSGTHETTRLCLEAIEKNIKPCCEMLDIGCGSGILSIAALLLGAGHATAVDIDKLAVKTARENALRNGIDEERYTVYNGSLADKVSGKFDIVAANIVADAIIALSSDVGRLMNEDGVYIVSGIIDSRETEVAAALDKYGFEIINRYSENGWICLESIVKKI